MPNEAQPAAGTTTEPTDRIGYGHPPLHSRWRPGQSGNPNGRPKTRRSFARDLKALLDAQSPTDANKTVQQMLAENLLSDALARKALQLKMLLPIIQALDSNESDAETDAAAEEKLIADFERREESTAHTQGGDDAENS